MGSIKRGFLVILLILAMLSSMLVLPACGGDDDDDDVPTVTQTAAPTTNKPTTTAEPTATGDKEEASYTLRMSHMGPTTSGQGLVAEKFAQLINDYTDGRVKVDIFPNSMLFLPQEEVQAAQQGAQDVLWGATYFLSSYVQYLMLSYLTGFWESPEHCIRFNTHPDVVARVSADLEETGLHFLGMGLTSMQSGFVTNKRELTSMKDMNGLRYGAPAGQPSNNLIHWLGVEEVQMDMTEMLTGFQTGMFDIYANNVTTLVAEEVWDMAKHGIVNPRGVNQSYLLAINSDTWGGLPLDIQEIITNKVVPETMDFCHQLRDTVESEAIETLRANLDTLHIATDAEIEQMLADTTDYSLTKMFISMAGDMYEVAESVRPSGD